jgi:hypothetical protein
MSKKDLLNLTLTQCNRLGIAKLHTYVSGEIPHQERVSRFGIQSAPVNSILAADNNLPPSKFACNSHGYFCFLDPACLPVFDSLRESVLRWLTQDLDASEPNWAKEWVDRESSSRLTYLDLNERASATWATLYLCPLTIEQQLYLISNAETKYQVVVPCSLVNNNSQPKRVVG